MPTAALAVAAGDDRSRAARGASARWRSRSTSPFSSSTARSARTAPCRASSSWPASRTPARACWPARWRWTRSSSRTSCAATGCRSSSRAGSAAAHGTRSPTTSCATWPGPLGERVVVKPARLGSSVGMSLVHQLDELPAALDEAFSYDSKVIVEAYVEGARELECGVLGNDDPIVFEPGEVRSATSSMTTRRSTSPGLADGRAARRGRPGPRGTAEGALAGRLPGGGCARAWHGSTSSSPPTRPICPR